MASFEDFLVAPAPKRYRQVRTPIATYLKTATRSYLTTFHLQSSRPISRGDLIRSYTLLHKTLERAEAAATTLARAIASRPHLNTGPARRAPHDLEEVLHVVNTLTCLLNEQQAFLTALAGYEAEGKAPGAYAFPWSERYGMPQGVDFTALCVASELEKRLAKGGVKSEIIRTAEVIAEIISGTPDSGPRPQGSRANVPKFALYSPPPSYVPPRVLRKRSTRFAAKPVGEFVHVQTHAPAHQAPHARHAPRFAAPSPASTDSDSLDGYKASDAFAPGRKASRRFRFKKAVRGIKDALRPAAFTPRPATPAGYRRVRLDNWPRNGVEGATLDWAAATAIVQLAAAQRSE